MFEPEELMARIVDLEAQLKVSEMAPPAAEQLIACLEGEIAKRDARIVELERAEKNDAIAYKAVLERQDELRAELAAAKVTIDDLGFALSDSEDRRSRAARNCSAFEDRMGLYQAECGKLKGELAAIKAQYLELAALSPRSPLTIAAPVSEAKAQEPDCDRSACGDFSPGPCDNHDCSARRDRMVFATAAKAQGVVMPEPMKRGDEGGSGEYGAAMIRGYNACLREVARLNSAPAQQVSVPDGWKLAPVEPTHEMLGAALMNQVECLDAIEVIRTDYKAMLAAAPAPGGE